MQIILALLLCMVLLVVVIVVTLIIRTRPENLARFDKDTGQHFTPDGVSLATFAETVEGFAQMTKALEAMPEGERLALQRQAVEGMASMKEFPNQFIAVDNGRVKGEWVLPTHGRIVRKVLFIHGGFFMMGSPNTHRPVTTRIAEECDAVVFSLDYSLQPENPRKKMIPECQEAYRWLVTTTIPEGGQATDIIIMGDSAGANLALVTSRWASRQKGLLPPKAVVAHSPTTDASLLSLTLANRHSDLLVAPAMAPLLKIPNFVWRLAALVKFKVRLNDPEISPLFGDLSGIPRTLLMSSGSELMLGDSIRYANKAASQGANVKLQVWNGLPHAWLALDIPCDATNDGFAEITRFVTAAA